MTPAAAAADHAPGMGTLAAGPVYEPRLVECMILHREPIDFRTLCARGPQTGTGACMRTMRKAVAVRRMVSSHSTPSCT
jgi:hypothetical protein